MTEPDVASSDATNIRLKIERQGDEYVLNGRKWWTSGAGDKRCKIADRHGSLEPRRAAPPAAGDDPRAEGRAGREARCARYRCSATTRAVRPLRDRIRQCPRAGRRTCCWARGAASRSRRAVSGPGRIHHCMRMIGVAERALEAMIAALEAGASPSASRLADQGVDARGDRRCRAARSSRRGC